MHKYFWRFSKHIIVLWCHCNKMPKLVITMAILSASRMHTYRYWFFFRNAALRGWGSLQFVKGLPKMIKRMSLQSPFFLDKVCYLLLLFCVAILTISGLCEPLNAITSPSTYPGRLIGWLVGQWACLAVLFLHMDQFPKDRENK